MARYSTRWEVSGRYATVTPSLHHRYAIVTPPLRHRYATVAPPLPHRYATVTGEGPLRVAHGGVLNLQGIHIVNGGGIELALRAWLRPALGLFTNGTARLTGCTFTNVTEAGAMAVRGDSRAWLTGCTFTNCTVHGTRSVTCRNGK